MGDPLIQFGILGLAIGLVMLGVAKIMSDRFDREFGTDSAGIPLKREDDQLR